MCAYRRYLIEEKLRICVMCLTLMRTSVVLAALEPRKKPSVSHRSASSSRSQQILDITDMTPAHSRKSSATSTTTRVALSRKSVRRMKQRRLDDLKVCVRKHIQQKLKKKQLRLRKNEKCLVSDRIRIGKSPIQGWGLFTMQDISKDKVVVEYVGEVVRSKVFRSH